MHNIALKAALAGLLILAAPAYAETVLRAYEDQAGSQGRESLRLECLNEAEWSTGERNKKIWFREHNVAVHQPPTEETIRLKDLCREMDGLASGTSRQPFELARQCAEAIHAGIRGNAGADNVRHFENMRRICEAMTGTKVPE